MANVKRQASNVRLAGWRVLIPVVGQVGADWSRISQVSFDLAQA